MELVDPTEVGGPALPLRGPHGLTSHTSTPLGDGARYGAWYDASWLPPRAPLVHHHVYLPRECQEPRSRISRKPPRPHTLLKTKAAIPPASMDGATVL